MNNKKDLENLLAKLKFANANGKRAGLGDILQDNVIYLILLVIFVGGMLYFLFQQQEGAAVWEDYYTKEIVKLIDFSNAGDKICIDVHKATKIAKKNGVSSDSEIFQIDNVENKACTKLSSGRRTCYSYFNDIDIVNFNLTLAGGVNDNGDDVNIYCFELAERTGEKDE